MGDLYNGMLTDNGWISTYSSSSPYITTTISATNALINNWDVVDRTFLKSDNINTKDIELRINVKKHKLKLNFEL